MNVHTTTPDHVAADVYLELLKTCLTDSLRPERFISLQPGAGGLAQSTKKALVRTLERVLGPLQLEVVRRIHVDMSERLEGKDRPIRAETMVGRKRLDQLQSCVEQILKDNIPGDLIECGVWRGGATILMRGVLKAYGDAQRRVWVADSFEGLPPPDEEHFPADKGDQHHRSRSLAIGLDQVKANFTKYGLLDDQLKFLVGWFKDSLPTAPIDRLAVLRADGDMYASTTQILTFLYPKLSPGGYCIIDDYGALPGCRQATDDYRRQHGITEPLQPIDWTGVFWRRAG